MFEPALAEVIEFKRTRKTRVFLLSATLSKSFDYVKFGKKKKGKGKNYKNIKNKSKGIKSSF